MTKLYNRWKGAKARCYNPNKNSYKNYGGRGIKMYKAWINNPDLYIAYIGSLPNCLREGYTLDRVHNDFDYEPMNLRWATVSEQNTNQRTRTDNSSGVKGVSKINGTDRWVAKLYKQGKLIKSFTGNSMDKVIAKREDYYNGRG